MKPHTIIFEGLKHRVDSVSADGRSIVTNHGAFELDPLCADDGASLTIGTALLSALRANIVIRRAPMGRSAETEADQRTRWESQRARVKTETLADARETWPLLSKQELLTKLAVRKSEAAEDYAPDASLVFRIVQRQPRHISEASRMVERIQFHACDTATGKIVAHFADVTYAQYPPASTTPAAVDVEKIAAATAAAVQRKLAHSIRAAGDKAAAEVHRVARHEIKKAKKSIIPPDKRRTYFQDETCRVLIHRQQTIPLTVKEAAVVLEYARMRKEGTNSAPFKDVCDAVHVANRKPAQVFRRNRKGRTCDIFPLIFRRADASGAFCLATWPLTLQGRVQK